MEDNNRGHFRCESEAVKMETVKVYSKDSQMQKTANFPNNVFNYDLGGGPSKSLQKSQKGALLRRFSRDPNKIFTFKGKGIAIR